MFSYISDIILPRVFEFASYLVSLSKCSLSEFTGFINSLEPLNVVNIVTGEVTEWISFTTPLIGGPITVFLRVLTFGIPSSVPLWVALTFGVINGFFIVVIVKFIIHIIF